MRARGWAISKKKKKKNPIPAQQKVVISTIQVLLLMLKILLYTLLPTKKFMHKQTPSALRPFFGMFIFSCATQREKTAAKETHTPENCSPRPPTPPPLSKKKNWYVPNYKICKSWYIRRVSGPCGGGASPTVESDGPCWNQPHSQGPSSFRECSLR